MQQTAHSEALDPLWGQRRTEQREAARKALVERYVGLVKYVAGRMAVGLPHYVDFADLYSAGLLGLIQAIDNYEPERANKFETYAVPRIRGAILDELRSQDWFPRSLRRKARQLEEAYARLERRLGRSATDEEVARELEISLPEFQEMVGQVAVATLISLDSEAHGDESGSTRLGDTLPDPKGVEPDEHLAQQEMAQVIGRALAELPDKEQLVLTLYYYEELTLKEIGEILEVTESRICQIHTKAIFRLRGKVQRSLSGRSLERLGQEVAASLASPPGRVGRV